MFQNWNRIENFGIHSATGKVYQPLRCVVSTYSTIYFFRFGTNSWRLCAVKYEFHCSHFIYFIFNWNYLVLSGLREDLLYNVIYIFAIEQCIPHITVRNSISYSMRIYSTVMLVVWCTPVDIARMMSDFVLWRELCNILVFNIQQVALSGVDSILKLHTQFIKN